MARILGWAVLCASGDIHADDEGGFLFVGDEPEAEDDARGCVLVAGPDICGCGPHRAAPLVEAG